MKILSIETSCDETAISIIEAKGEISSPSFEVLSDEIISQVNLHQEFGGVYPSLAKREHAKNLPIILEKTLKNADLFVSGKTEISKDEILKILEREPEMAENLWKIISCIEKPEIEYIAVTAGPGLEPALWVGITFAKALARAWNIPLVSVNHMEGHILSFLLQDKENKINKKQIEFPALSLLISGGHTELILVKDWTKYEKIGQTVDDAVGEAFDKVARILGLPYPGGPEISKLSELGKENEKIKLPRPMIKTNDFNFSFSGLKTAVLYLVRDLGEISEQDKKDIAREFEKAVGDVFVHKIKNAIKKYGVKELIIGGGVSANKYLRERLTNDLDVEVLLPSKKLSTDNSIMIGIAGYFKIISNPKKIEGPDSVRALPNWSVDD